MPAFGGLAVALRAILLIDGIVSKRGIPGCLSKSKAQRQTTETRAKQNSACNFQVPTSCDRTRGDRFRCVKKKTRRIPHRNGMQRALPNIQPIVLVVRRMQHAERIPALRPH